MLVGAVVVAVGTREARVICGRSRKWATMTRYPPSPIAKPIEEEGGGMLQMGPHTEKLKSLLAILEHFFSELFRKLS